MVGVCLASLARYGHHLYCTLRKSCAFASKIIKLSLMRISKWVHIHKIYTAYCTHTHTRSPYEWQKIYVSNAKRFTINWAWNDVANKLLYAYTHSLWPHFCVCVCFAAVVGVRAVPLLFAIERNEKQKTNWWEITWFSLMIRLRNPLDFKGKYLKQLKCSSYNIRIKCDHMAIFAIVSLLSNNLSLHTYNAQWWFFSLFWEFGAEKKCNYIDSIAIYERPNKSIVTNRRNKEIFSNQMPK